MHINYYNAVTAWANDEMYRFYLVITNDTCILYNNLRCSRNTESYVYKYTCFVEVMYLTFVTWLTKSYEMLQSPYDLFRVQQKIYRYINDKITFIKAS